MEPRALARGFRISRRRNGAGREQSESDVGDRGPEEGAETNPGRGGQFLLLWFTDLEGHLKSFAVTEIEEALNDGMGFDGSSITGFNAIEESDMVAIPDPSTFQHMPWREGETRVARMICGDRHAGR